MQRAIIGIDPGQKGGLAAIGVDSGRLIDWTPMPMIGKTIDAGKVRAWIQYNSMNTPTVAIEIQGVRPEQGAVSGFRIGENYGILLGLCMGCAFSRHMFRPQEWQKAMLAGKPRGDQTKLSSYRTCKELWPEEDWLASSRCKNAHDGGTDAALIGEYCRRKLWNILG